MPTPVECFTNHVQNYDLEIVFDCGADKVKTLEKIKKEAEKVFSPYSMALGTDDGGWIQANWEGSKKRGFKWQLKNNRTKEVDFGNYHTPVTLEPMDVDLEPIDVELAKLPLGIIEALITLSSSRGWNISRRGSGIKSILKESKWQVIENNYNKYHVVFNRALKEIADFNPETENTSSFYKRIKEGEKWEEHPDLSVPFHLVWPQYFPVWYKKTQDSYSQITGMNKLLDELADRLECKRNLLDLFNNYDHYAAAYRVLLLAYHEFVIAKKIKPPHFDYLTLLLAELDPQTDNIRMLLTRKALVLYGVPGTGKTYAATQEIGPAIAKKDHIKIIQFHPGYSYADFIIGIRPKSESGGVTYPVVPGILYRIAAEAALALPRYKDDANPEVEQTPSADNDHESKDDKINEPSEIGNNKATDSEIGSRDEAQQTPPTNNDNNHEIKDGNSNESSEEDNNAETDPEKASRFVLVIDEINRAELSRVLGEVMMMMEYRACYQNGQDKNGEKHITHLPHILRAGEKVVSIFNGTELPNDPFDGGRKFFFPDNLYLIGTMNHVDRSISGFDMALRRRFAWAEHKFSASKLREILENKINQAGIKIKNIEEFVKRCRSFNQWIENGQAGKNENDKGKLPFQHEHVLGHTFFAEIVGILVQENSKEKKFTICPHHLERLWLYHVKPQLEDALGYEVGTYRDSMRKLGDGFTEKLT